MRSHAKLVAALLPLVLACAACASDGDGEAVAREDRSSGQRLAAASAQEVVVRTRDYAFDAPDTIAGGPTTFRLINEGPDYHHIWLVRLEAGKTLGDLVNRLASGHGAMPDWATDIGGPNTPGLPGEETTATIDLEPGDYAMICVIPAPDGQPHIMKGMFRPLVVVPGDAVATMPTADLVMTLDDYTFETDRPIATGRHTIRVENVADQAHEVLIVRLEPGRTAGEFMNWVVSREGDPPGKPIGGVTGMARGVSNVITVDFKPGEYALLCFVPDAGDGQPHVAHGMVKQFRVG